MDSDKYLMYIYNLPYTERKELCLLLDSYDKWEELGGRWMGIDVLTLQYYRKEPSPTHELLTHWGMLNHTVFDLFDLLSRMQNYRAMKVLKPLVDPKYHSLIDEGEENLSTLFAKQQLQKHTGSCTSQRTPSLSEKDLGVSANNLNINDATGLLKEIKISNTPLQNRETTSTEPIIRTETNTILHEDHSTVSVVNDELANGAYVADLYLHSKGSYPKNNSCNKSPLTPCDDLPLMTELVIKPQEPVHSNSPGTRTESS